ncbi:MAG TPA: hypothetical protein VNZ43_04585 [Sphingomonadaceae bacterium]|nr:hypothetical protein [Sphingomonadaceae bacterium]
MTQISTVNSGSRQIALHSITGEVTDSKKWATTEISGGGGEGVISNGSGYIKQDELKSKTTTHDQIIIRTADGQEESLKVEDLHLAVAQGHWVSFIRAIPSGWAKGPVVAILNHNTGSKYFIDSAIKEACGKSLIGIGTIVLLLYGIYVCYQSMLGYQIIQSRLILGLLLMAPCPVYYFREIRRYGAFKDQVSALCDQIKVSQAAPKSVSA